MRLDDFFVSGGVYKLDIPSGGITPKEFENIDEHPFIVVKVRHESEMFYAIQLTSITDDRVKTVTKLGNGCVLNSINSIAKLNKMIVIGTETISDKFINNVTKQPTMIALNELRELTKRLVAFVNNSFMDCVLSYEKYHNQFANMKEIVLTDRIYQQQIIFKEEKQEFSFKFVKKDYSELTRLDFLSLFASIFDKRDVFVVISQRSNHIFVNISNNDSKYLTFKEKYDKLNIVVNITDN